MKVDVVASIGVGGQVSVPGGGVAGHLTAAATPQFPVNAAIEVMAGVELTWTWFSAYPAGDRNLPSRPAWGPLRIFLHKSVDT